MKSPTYNNPAAVDEPDVLAAVINFARMFGVPSMDETDGGRFFIGWGNRYALPSDNEFCVVTQITQARRGTGLESFSADDRERTEDGVLTMSEAVDVTVQVDFVSEIDGYARRRAQALETACRASAGPRFFRDYGISCHYADDIHDLTAADDANQFVSRWNVTLHLSYVTAITAELPWFDTVHVNKIQNADLLKEE